MALVFPSPRWEGSWEGNWRGELGRGIGERNFGARSGHYLLAFFQAISARLRAGLAFLVIRMLFTLLLAVLEDLTTELGHAREVL